MYSRKRVFCFINATLIIKQLPHILFFYTIPQYQYRLILRITRKPGCN